jgi:hypothetical protein
MWLASEDDDDWSAYPQFKTREEAIQNGARCLGVTGKFYIGKKKYPEVFRIDVKTLVSIAQDQAWSEIGSKADGWLEATSEQLAVLQGLLDSQFEAWANRYGFAPHWFVVTDIEVVK